MNTKYKLSTQELRGKYKYYLLEQATSILKGTDIDKQELIYQLEDTVQVAKFRFKLEREEAISKIYLILLKML